MDAAGRVERRRRLPPVDQRNSTMPAAEAQLGRRDTDQALTPVVRAGMLGTTPSAGTFRQGAEGGTPIGTARGGAPGAAIVQRRVMHPVVSRAREQVTDGGDAAHSGDA